MIPCPLCPATHDDPGNPCPGPCNTAWVKAERRHHQAGEAHELLPIPGQPVWCADCRDQITEHLAGLPGLAAMLPSGPLQTPATELGRLSPADVHVSPSPGFDLLDEVTQWARHLEDDTRERLGHPRPERHRSIRRSVAYLTGYTTHLLSRGDDAVQLGMEIRAWHRRLTFATGTSPASTVRVPGQCPACNARGLASRREGDDLVRCSGCSAVHDLDGWEAAQKARAS